MARSHSSFVLVGLSMGLAVACSGSPETESTSKDDAASAKAPAEPQRDEPEPAVAPARRPGESGFRPEFRMADSGGGKEPVRFDWTAPCSVPVRQYRYRSDQGVTTMSMVLTVESAGDSYRLRYADIRLEEAAGMDLDSPRMKEALEEAEANAAAMMPVSFISKTGDFESVAGHEEMVELLMATRPRITDEIREMMRSPQMREQLEEAAGEQWRVWVELWKDFELAPGDTHSEEQDVQFFSVVLPSTFDVAYAGAVAGHPDLRLYRGFQVVEGDKARDAMQAFFESTAKQVGRTKPLDRNLVKSFRKETTLEVAIDPHGAFPHRARTESVAEINDQRRVEVYDWEFDWSKAEGCRQAMG